MSFATFCLCSAVLLPPSPFAATVLFLIFELFLSLHERKEAHDYKKASPRKKVMIMYKCLCRICAICEIDLCLGYNSAEIDGQIADCFSDVAEETISARPL